jgi:Spy/CpxP family protein refolding chaperone
MKRNIIALTAVCSLALGAFTIAQAHDPAEGGPSRHGKGGHRWGNPLGHLAEKLDLTADQKAKVQPIIDQAKPQIRAIHQEAMQKAKAVMDTTMAQIRPLLTPEQVTKLDAMKAAREKMREARKEMHDAAEE